MPGWDMFFVWFLLDCLFFLAAPRNAAFGAFMSGTDVCVCVSPQARNRLFSYPFSRHSWPGIRRDWGGTRREHGEMYLLFIKRLRRAAAAGQSLDSQIKLRGQHVQRLGNRQTRSQTNHKHADVRFFGSWQYRLRMRKCIHGHKRSFGQMAGNTFLYYLQSSGVNLYVLNPIHLSSRSACTFPCHALFPTCPVRFSRFEQRCNFFLHLRLLPSACHSGSGCCDRCLGLNPLASAEFCGEEAWTRIPYGELRMRWRALGPEHTPEREREREREKEKEKEKQCQKECRNV